MKKLSEFLSAPVNNAPLVIWRIAFGALMALESWGAIATGWVYRNLIEPSFTFSFIGLEWLQPLPGNGMYFYFSLMGLAAVCVAVGWRYRAAAVVLAILWTGAYFMQKTSYNNHYYLAVLLCWWMVLLPANRRFSLDAARLNTSSLVHRKWISVFAKASLFIVFTYGSVAKFYPGWLNGDFIRQSFNGKVNYPVIGPLLGQPWFQDFITYSAIAFDGLIIPLLWWKSTRTLAFWGLVAFNLFNSVVFQIGIFPYLVLAMTVFFFSPEAVEKFFRLSPKRALSTTTNAAQHLSWLSTSLIVLYFGIQLALPLRHHLIPGDVNWREEGHRMSWRMMLRAKGGRLALEATNNSTGERERIVITDFVSQKQATQLASKPDFLYQFVQRLKVHYQQRGWDNLSIHATRSKVYLNGKGPWPLYNDTVDLAKVEWNYFGRNDWVLDRKME